MSHFNYDPHADPRVPTDPRVPMGPPPPPAQSHQHPSAPQTHQPMDTGGSYHPGLYPSPYQGTSPYSPIPPMMESTYNPSGYYPPAPQNVYSAAAHLPDRPHQYQHTQKPPAYAGSFHPSSLLPSDTDTALPPLVATNAVAQHPSPARPQPIPRSHPTNIIQDPVIEEESVIKNPNSASNVDEDWLSDELLPFLRYAFASGVPPDYDFDPHIAYGIRNASDEGFSIPEPPVEEEDDHLETVIQTVLHSWVHGRDAKDPVLQGPDVLALYLIRQCVRRGPFKLLDRDWKGNEVYVQTKKAEKERKEKKLVSISRPKERSRNLWGGEDDEEEDEEGVIKYSGPDEAFEMKGPYFV
ncbi:hypothetical protein P154DRAFT_603889 [Amniculicola lignicola CBS 123094]|uniref:Uncharacterized protein n=1 Tax=Amniculicola lignicola CBS 123094 TaxID=1392246 RepID=A0A6A5X0Z6_9PLEO|nr:hypothetical protein P154DRAFT_603889 [Amniculicola lignicola CBS 123094]